MKILDKTTQTYKELVLKPGGDTLPIGAILPFSSDTIPNGWLLCDGRAVSRTKYAELFKAIGTKHGSGDGSTTFNLPNQKGRTLVGKNSTDTDFNTLGKTGGEKTHTLTVDEMPSHTHTVRYLKQTAGNDFQFCGGTGAWQTTGKVNTNIESTGGGQPHNNLQPYLVTNYIIKAKNTVVVKGDVIQENDIASTTNVYSSVAMDNKLKTNIVTGQEVATNEYVDGKQIFRKRVDVGNLPGASDKKLVSIGLTNVNIINFSGYYFSSYEGFGIPINHATGTNYYVQTYLVLNTMKIDISCGSDRSSYTGYVDIYYTKNR